MEKEWVEHPMFPQYGIAAGPIEMWALRRGSMQVQRQKKDEIEV